MNIRPEPTIKDNCGTWAGYKRHARNKEKKCQACAIVGKKINAERYVANREKRLSQQKQYRLKNHDLVKERKKLYYQKNKEKVRAGIKRWESQNRDKVLQYQRQWHANNKQKSRAHSLRMAHRRNALKRNNKTEVYTEAAVIKLYGTKCYICQNEIDFEAPRTPRFKGWHFGLHIDHVIPISKGGGDAIENVRPVHAICNLRKSAKLNDEYSRMATKISI